MSVGDALRYGAERLSVRDDIALNARRDAQSLLEIATGQSGVFLRTHPEVALELDVQSRFEGLLGARLQAVPIQHLRGSQEFYGRDFRVTPDVLIPRPESEILVEQTLKRADRTRPLRIADIGTGSGILAITLALELPLATMWAGDLSLAALAIAQENANRHKAASRITFAESDLLTQAGIETFNIIVSNPPYVPLRERHTLHPQVRDYEPATALFGGKDGLEIFRRLLPQAWKHLQPGGWLLLETGGDVAPIQTMLTAWSAVEVIPDLQGIPRIIAAQRP